MLGQIEDKAYLYSSAFVKNHLHKPQINSVLPVKHLATQQNLRPSYDMYVFLNYPQRDL